MKLMIRFLDYGLEGGGRREAQGVRCQVSGIRMFQLEV
jgi:hypothetical protein